MEKAMFTEKVVKTFVILAGLSLVGLFIFSQSLGYHQKPRFLQDPSEKPSRVRNHKILENAEVSFEALPETTSSNGVHSETWEGNPPDLKTQASASLTVKTNMQNNLGPQTTSSERDKRPRLPKALIIGFSKCGTAALRTFLTIHPDVVSPILELQFFTLNYTKGLEWYRKQMPPSTENQLTIEKTPSYILSNASLQRIRDFNPNIKLMVIVRDPIVRLQSQFAHHFRNTEPSKRPTLKNFFSQKRNDIQVIHYSYYARYIRQVYNFFPENQLLVINEGELEKDPLLVLKEAEKFLGLRPAYSDDMFVFSDKKGFYCFNVHGKLFPRVLTLVQVNRSTGCLGRDKGREHTEIDKNYLKHLKQVIRPLNEELFELIGKRFRWENFMEQS